MNDTRHILAPTLEQEEVALRHQRSPKDRNWTDEHNRALANPKGVEVALIGLAENIERWIDHQETTYSEGRGTWRDGVGGPAVAEMLQGFAGLLDHDTGRLDAGTLSSWVNETALRIGFDPDLWEWHKHENDRVRVEHDGKVVALVGSVADAYGWLHRHQGQSAHYAMTYAGYRIMEGGKQVAP